MEIREYIISEEYSILDAMEVINQNERGIAYVCDGTVLKAAVTDGNIRRHILDNGDLHAQVSTVANYSPKFIMRRDNVDHVSFMKQHHITSVPILNSKKEIITIKFLHASPSYTSDHLNVPVVIMAGGKGTRLEPYTKVLPKPLIPVGVKTITELIMDKFTGFGCDRFNMIVNYKKDLIKAFFLDEEKHYHVSFTDEQQFMGTGGGLKLLAGMYDSTFFMTNCDILIDEDYGEILNQHKADNRIITMVCALKTITVPYGTIQISEDGYVKELEEKPSMTYKVNTGLYVIEPRFLDYIPDNTFIHITDAIEACISAGEKVGVYPISETSWWDMGQFSELEKMQKKFDY